MTDLDIIKLVLKEDKSGFALLYKRYSEKVYNTSLSYTKDIEEAEEVTQDVFLKIYKNISSFKQDSSLSTWIYRITVNTALNSVKKKKRFTLFRKNFNNSTQFDFNHPGVLLENKENASALYKVIDCLPTNQKTAFILSFIEDLPRQKVADIMEISLKAVESLLQRGKKNMKNELEKLYPNRRIIK